MKSFLFPLGLVLLLAAFDAGYGLLEDHSEFVSAKLTPDGHTVVFTAHLHTYRPATGWRAFPDGGLPDYVSDVHVIGMFDRKAGKFQILRREKNTDWQHGSGKCVVIAANDGKALISQGGQLHGSLGYGLKFWLVDLTAPRVDELNLVAQLAKRGRDSGQIHLVDGDGTLVFVTVSLTQAKQASAYRDNSIIPEVWVRTPAGEYLQAATTAHYQTTSNGEVFYWEPIARKFLAYSIATHGVREAPQFRVSTYADEGERARVSSNHKGLEYVVRNGDQWQIKPFELTLDALR